MMEAERRGTVAEPVAVVDNCGAHEHSVAPRIFHHHGIGRSDSLMGDYVGDWLACLFVFAKDTAIKRTTAKFLFREVWQGWHCGW